MMRRRTFIARGLSSLVLAAGGSAVYAGGIERHLVETTTVRLDLGLAAPLRVVAIGDIHFDPLYETDYLEAVSARIRALAPDFVLFTGDFVSKTAKRVADLAPILARTNPRLGSCAVLGNHDFWCGPRQVSAALERHGIAVLRNAAVPIPGCPDWFLAGLESFWAGRPDASFVGKAPPEARFITLVHEPDVFELLTDSRIRLQISGHTHGGQVRVPFVGALTLPSWGRRFDAGLFRRGERALYVNRGIGTVRFHVRMNCRPEITLLELS